MVEAQWHPARGQRINILHYEQGTSGRHTKSVLKGMRLLRTLDPRGRPPSITTLIQGEFLAMYGEARADYLADGRPPTDNNLLPYLPVRGLLGLTQQDGQNETDLVRWSHPRLVRNPVEARRGRLPIGPTCC